MRDEDAKLVQVAERLRVEAQLADAAVELFGPIVRIFRVYLVGPRRGRRRRRGLVFVGQVSQESRIFHQARFDVLVEEELREDEELFAQELVGEIDGRVDDAGAVRSDRIGHVSDADGVEMLAAARLLGEELVVQIVIVLANEHVDVAHDFLIKF